MTNYTQIISTGRLLKHYSRLGIERILTLNPFDSEPVLSLSKYPL